MRYAGGARGGAVLVALSGIAAIPAVSYSASARRHHRHQDCTTHMCRHYEPKREENGTLIVDTYLGGDGKPPRHEEKTPPPEPNRSRSIGIFRNGELLREVEPPSSQTRFELKPGGYEVPAGCGKARAVVRPDRTSRVKVYCYRK